MAGLDESDIGTIEGIYAAALDAGLWPSVLERLAAAFGARQASLYAHDLRNRDAGIAAHWAIEAGFARSYVAHFGQVNPFVDGVAKLAVGRSATADELVPADVYAGSEFFNDWVRPQGGREFLTTTLLRDGGRMTGLTVLRGATPFDARERQRWDALALHVTRAMQVHRQIHRATLISDGLLAALGRLSVGAVLVGEDGDVLFANGPAERRFGPGTGLEVRQGRLCGETLAATERLAGAIRAAIRTAAGWATEPGDLLVMPCRTGPGLPVLVSPLGAAGPPTGLDRPLALLLVGGVRDRSARRGDLARAFGLTRAEAGLLVGLVEGRSLSDHAALSGIAVETARKHLRNVLGKTGTTRQVDVVRRVLDDPVLMAGARTDTRRAEPEG